MDMTGVLHCEGVVGSFGAICFFKLQELATASAEGSARNRAALLRRRCGSLCDCSVSMALLRVELQGEDRSIMKREMEQNEKSLRGFARILVTTPRINHEV